MLGHYLPFDDTNFEGLNGTNNLEATTEEKGKVVVYNVRRKLIPDDRDEHDYNISKNVEFPMIYAWGTGTFKYHGPSHADFSIKIEGDEVTIKGLDQFDYHVLHG